MQIKTIRIYDNPKGSNGFRIFVDRLWPRGLSKDMVDIDLWLKDIAPSTSLRKWFGHDKKKWIEFKRRYFQELDKNRVSVITIVDKKDKGSVILLYSSKEKEHNNVVALKEYLEEKINGQSV